MKLTGNDQMYFYDAIAPIVAAETIDIFNRVPCCPIR